MSLTIETTPEIEQKLRVDAERRGMDAASYVLKLLEERYVQAPTSPTAPAAGWHSLSGLDADAVEERRRGTVSEMPSPPSRYRVTHRERRRQRRRKIWTLVAAAVGAAVLLAALALTLLFRISRHPRGSLPPRLSAPGLGRRALFAPRRR